MAQPQAPTDLEKMMALLQQSQQQRSTKQDALNTLAAEQTQGQGFNPGGKVGAWDMFTGGGGASSPQRQAMMSMYSSVLNKKPGQSGIGAASRGMQKGNLLLDNIRGRSKQERMEAIQGELSGIDANRDSMDSLYNLQKSADDTTYNRGMDKRDNERQERRDKRSDFESDREYRQSKAKQDLKDGEAALAENDELKRAADKAELIYNDIDAVREGISGWTEGMTGSGMSVIRGTDAFDQSTRIDGLKAKLGLDQLRELRAAAASGASGMGNLTEKELDRLEAAITKLDIGQTKEEQEKSLKILEEYYVPALEAYDRVYGTKRAERRDQGATVQWGDL
jgi:hypothetical protein